MGRRAVIVVLDGLGAGDAPDAAAFGDEGANTLANTARAVGGLDAAEPRVSGPRQRGGAGGRAARGDAPAPRTG